MYCFICYSSVGAYSPLQERRGKKLHNTLLSHLHFTAQQEISQLGSLGCCKFNWGRSAVTVRDDCQKLVSSYLFQIKIHSSGSQPSLVRLPSPLTHVLLFSSSCQYCHHHHHHQPLNPKGRWGTTDDFATSFLHFSLFSTALWDLPNSRPVHSLMLSSHLFLCLPCLLSLFTVPCKMILARPDERETWPYHCSLHLFTMVRRSSCGPIACWILAQTSSLVTWSLYEMCSILR